MIIGSCKVSLRADWVGSLKEKRAVIKSLTSRVKNKFNVSVAEVENQDLHKEITIGFACVTNETRHAQSILQNVLDFIENNTEAEITDVETEII